MYKVIGADGKEYGPISAGVLREWIGQGRVNGKTSVLPEGATEWKTLAELPEFGAALTAAATPVMPPQLSAPSVPAATNPLATTGFVLSILSVTVGLCCCYGFPFNLAGVICSGVALSQINRDPLNQSGRGIALAGIIISVLSLVLSGFLLVLWGSIMALPNAARHLHRL